MSSRCGLAGLTRAGQWSMSFPAATRARSMLRRERPVEYWAPMRVSFMSVLSGRAPRGSGPAAHGRLVHRPRNELEG
jgi:hypothetical protein